MQLGGKPPARSNSLFDEDFASGFEDSKFDKLKPLLKALVAILVVVGLGVGGLWIYGNNANKNNFAINNGGDNLSESYEPVASVDETAIKFNDCTKTATDKTKDLQTSDPNFSKKLIAGYDEWLTCYDEYPENAASASPGRSSLEYARQSAIDSSGSYKDTYLSSNSYTYSSSTYIPSYSPNSGSSTDSKSPDPTNQGNSASQSQDSAVDAAWCNSKKSEVDNLYVQYQAARNAVDSLNTKIFNVERDVRRKSGSLPESQVQAMINRERNNLESQKPSLIAQQNSTKSKYDTAQSEYSNKGCHR